MHMVEDSQASAHHFQLVSEQMPDMFCLDRTYRTNRIFRFELMWNRLVLQACCVVEDMLDTGSLVGLIGNLGRAIRGLLF